MGKKIKLSELKAGDIMLFEAPPELLSELIALLTESTVSHAGISDYNPGYVLNEQIDGAVRSPLHPKNERAIYIRRLENGANTDIVADIAKEYVEQNVPYGKLNLALLGVYMLGYRFSKHSKYENLIVSALKLAIFEIIKFVDEKHYHETGTNPMVCSQFAANCYDEAVKKKGFEYKIHYNENVTSVQNLLGDIIEYVKDHLSDSLEYKEGASFMAKADNANLNDDCLKELTERLQEEDDSSNDGAGENFVSEELVKLFYVYGRILLKLNGSTEEYKDITKEKVSSGELLKLFNDLLAFQETFITPGDLLSNTTNLLDMGILEYTPEELEKYTNE